MPPRTAARLQKRRPDAPEPAAVGGEEQFSAGERKTCLRADKIELRDLPDLRRPQVGPHEREGTAAVGRFEQLPSRRCVDGARSRIRLDQVSAVPAGRGGGRRVARRLRAQLPCAASVAGDVAVLMYAAGHQLLHEERSRSGAGEVNGRQDVRFLPASAGRGAQRMHRQPDIRLPPDAAAVVRALDGEQAVLAQVERPRPHGAEKRREFLRHIEARRTGGRPVAPRAAAVMRVQDIAAPGRPTARRRGHGER